MTTSRLSTFGIYFILTFFALSAPLGHFFQSTHLLKLGISSLASPLMIVYSELSGDRVMSFHYEVTLTDQNNEPRTFTFDKYRYNEMASNENPFNRHILILPYMAATTLLTDPGDKALIREQVLRYGLCNKGPYARYLDLDYDVIQANIKIYRNKKKEEIMNEYDLVCE